MFGSQPHVAAPQTWHATRALASVWFSTQMRHATAANTYRHNFSTQMLWRPILTPQTVWRASTPKNPHSHRPSLRHHASSLSLPRARQIRRAASASIGRLRGLHQINCRCPPSPRTAVGFTGLTPATVGRAGLPCAAVRPASPSRTAAPHGGPPAGLPHERQPCAAVRHVGFTRAAVPLAFSARWSNCLLQSAHCLTRGLRRVLPYCHTLPNPQYEVPCTIVF